MYIYIMMERTQIYLTRALRDALDQRARDTGRTRSELIREALERIYLQDDDDRRRRLRAALTRSAGAWSREDETGEAYTEGIRPGALVSRLPSDDA